MTSTKDRISERGLVRLFAVPALVGVHIAAFKHNGPVLTTGQFPLREGKFKAAVRPGTEVSVWKSTQAARVSASNEIDAAAVPAGGFDRVERIFELTGFLGTHEVVREHPLVRDGAGNMIIDVNGELGPRVILNIELRSLQPGNSTKVEIRGAVIEGSPKPPSQVIET